MKNNERELLNSELAKEELLLQEYIDERNKLILEERQLIVDKTVEDNNSYISLADYVQLARNRKEEFFAKNHVINTLDDKIKESNIKIANYEIRLGKKKVKDAKKEYMALCERINCEDKVRKIWILGASIKEYNLLKSNRMMLIDKIENSPNTNERLLRELRVEVNIINHQMNIVEIDRQKTLENINVLSIERDNLLDRGKVLIKKKNG